MNTIANSVRSSSTWSETRRSTPEPALWDGQVETADLWPILWHRRFWIGALVALCVGATLLYCMLTPSLYTAAAQLLIDPRDRVVITNDVNPSTIAPDGGVTQVESQARVIESSSVLLRAIKATGLAQDPEFAGGSLTDHVAGLFGLSPPTENEDAKERALLSLRRRLGIKRADKVFVIDVTVTSQSPAKSARIANAIAQAYLDDQAAARSDAARDASDSLVARLSEQQRKVNDTETAVEAYKAEHGIVAAANGILVTDQQLTDINAQLETARSRAAEAQTRLNQIEAARGAGAHDDATAEALGSPVITQLRARMATLVQREAELRADLGPRHPALAAAAAQRHDVKLLIGGELDRIVRAAHADSERARTNEADLVKRFDRLTAATLASKQASVRLRELERDRDASRTVYNAFLLRAQETREQAAIDSGNARIITQAMPPLDRSWPLTFYLVLGALGGGLGLGAAGAFASEYASPTVLSARQLQRVLGIRVIPVALPAAAGGSSGPHRRGPAGFDDPPPTTVHDAAFDLVLRRVVEVGSVVRGPDRLLSILLAAGEGGAAGAADLADRLAIAAAEDGERVLLVDATAGGRDEDPAPGLLEVVRGELSLDMAIRRHPDAPVMILGPGHRRRGQSDRRQAHNAATLFAQAARKFDIMIIDGGVAEHNPRIETMVAGIDDIFVVAERGVTPQRHALAAAEALAGMTGLPSAAFLIEAKAGV